MRVYNLRCESMRNPLGISSNAPRLTWNLASDRRGVVQKSFCVTVWEEKYINGKQQKNRIYSSNEVTQRETALILPEGLASSRNRYYWTVKVTDNHMNTATSSEGWFEMCLLQPSDWKAVWIEPDQNPVVKEEINTDDYLSEDQTFQNRKRRWIIDESKEITVLEDPPQSHEIHEEMLFPCPMLRTCFEVSGKVVKARMYATAHGLYSAELNGRKVGDYMLAPEASSYQDYLQVQTYDLQEMLKDGKNALGVILADGWWAGRVGCVGESCRYGDTLGLLLQIELTYEDGSIQVIGTDRNFVATCEGPRRYADLAIGEKYDSTRIISGWSEPDFDDRSWTRVSERNYSYSNLKGQNAQPIKFLKELDLVNSYISPKNEKILDFGQLIAGTAAMDLKGLPEDTILLRYFQVPDREGNYYFETMGSNSQMTDTIVLDHTGKAKYDPLFTLHGFRYIAITSEKGEVTISNARARLIASDVEVTSQIVTSDSKLNQLQKNIEWTIRSNILSILTDNPDRERSGWTGDTQMIAPTVCYTADAQAMFRRWIEYCRYEQGDEGEIPAIIPNWKIANTATVDSTAGWGDAVIYLPWHFYQKYGDIRILKDNYAMMQSWYNLEKKRASDANPPWIGTITPQRAEDLAYIWNADWNFGDWMTPSAAKDPETGEVRIGAMALCWLMGTYYYAYSSKLMEKIAFLIGEKKDAAMYHSQYERIRIAAIHEFYDTDEIYNSRYVGAQILAMHMGFYPEKDREKLLNRILNQLEKNGMDTGFSSSLVLPELLCENGYSEKMYGFLFKQEQPSWLYEVNQGATAVWESMEGLQPDGSISMCSFIQPAYCSIGNWMMEGMGGISAGDPGFATVNIHPYFTEKLDFVDASYQSEQGLIRCRWERNGTARCVKISIPANAKARVFLEKATLCNTISDNGNISSFDGLEEINEKDAGLSLLIGSGNYSFFWNLK